MTGGEQNLIVVAGQEGSGKSTTVRALLEVTPSGARIDAEDVGAVNPWRMDDDFLSLLHANVVALTRNFWAAGYRTVIAGSFFSNLAQYRQFKARLDSPCKVFLVHLCATRQTRDARRLARAKPTSPEWREMVDRADPEDITLRVPAGEYRYIRIDNDGMTAADVVTAIQRRIPEVYGRPV